MKLVTTKGRTRPWNRAKSPVPIRPYALGEDFIFGAATSAYQVEGGIDAAETGRGKTIWETYFDKRPELDTGEIACDHYHRMIEDVKLMKRL